MSEDKKANELLAQLKKLEAQPCPNCGHCPTCGRSAQPYWPVYPIPTYPYPSMPWITWTIDAPTITTTGSPITWSNT